MPRAKRFSTEAVSKKIRRWLSEENDSETSSYDNESIPDNNVCSPDITVDRPKLRDPDSVSGSEMEDCAEQQESPENSEESYEPSEADTDDSGDSTGDYTARSGMVWKKAVPSASKTKQMNIVKEASGPNVVVRDKTSSIEIYHMFMTPQILSAVLQFSNAEGLRRAEAKEPPCINWKLITMEELEATLGLLYLSGVLRMNKVSVRRIWAKNPVQNPIYPAVMSGERFAEILCLLRFDDKDTRESRRANDKFAPIREVWNLFVEQCRNLYKPSAYMTVDEQLLGFRGKCPFRQYIKSKPDRYGIKFWMCADAETFYVFNLKPYLGREETAKCTKNVSLGAQVVLKLVEPLEHSGRNVTCDNFFTSVQLSDNLLSKKLTLLGTVRKSNRDIPPEFLPNRSRNVGSSQFGFSDNKTLVSYVPKRNRAVVLLSTMHHDNKLDQETNKPDMIMEYNRTKGGVDTVDQLCHTYSVKRSTRRWPMCVFYGLLDIAAINSLIIFLHNNPNFHPKENCKRRFFLEELAMALIRPQLQYRQSHPQGLSEHTRRAMDIVGYTCVEAPKVPRQMTTRTSAKKRKRCFYCPTDKDRKVFTECDTCHNRVCPEHSNTTTSTLCLQCI